MKRIGLFFSVVSSAMLFGMQEQKVILKSKEEIRKAFRSVGLGDVEKAANLGKRYGGKQCAVSGFNLLAMRAAQKASFPVSRYEVKRILVMECTDR